MGDFPLADALVVLAPFLGLVGDELVAQLAAEDLFDEGIGGEGLHRLVRACVGSSPMPAGGELLGRRVRRGCPRAARRDRAPRGSLRGRRRAPASRRGRGCRRRRRCGFRSGRRAIGTRTELVRLLRP